MKAHSLEDRIRCQECKQASFLIHLKRILNFTEGEVYFSCKNCRRKLGMLPFSKWNELMKNAYLAKTGNEKLSNPQRRHSNRRRN